MSHPNRVLSLALLGLGVASAQEVRFAPPTLATYPCFVSASGWLDTAAKPGLSLTLKAGQQYTSTGGGVQESGTYVLKPDAKGVAPWAEAGGGITLKDAQGAVSASGVYGWVNGQLTLLMLVPQGGETFHVRCGKASLPALQSQIAAQGQKEQSGLPSPAQSTSPGPAQSSRPAAAAPAQGGALAGLAQTIEYQGQKYNVVSGQYEGTHQVRNYVLYRDGTIRREWPAVPVEAFNAAQSRRSEPNAWGTYRTSGTPGRDGSYAVTWKDGKQETLKLNFLTLAQPGQRLSATYAQTANGANTVPGASITAWRSISFTHDGRFRLQQGAGAGTTGTATAVNRQQEGRYDLFGNTLTLHYDSGQVSRLPFAFLMGEQQGGIYLDGVYLLPQR